MTQRALDYVTRIEGYYEHINPDPILSSMYDHSAETGIDLYESGAKHNNISTVLPIFNAEDLKAA